MKISLKTFLPVVTVSSLVVASSASQANKTNEIEIAKENCLKQAELDSTVYRNIFNATVAAKDTDKVAQFNDVAADMKYTFNEIDRMLTDEGISPKEYNMGKFKLAEDVDTSRVYQHFADSWMYKNFFKKIGILTPEIAKKCDEAALKTKP
ncbi:hypothetical protein EGQ24_02815 [bacterium]|nr:hypothetical protein [bacterium]